MPKPTVIPASRYQMGLIVGILGVVFGLLTIFISLDTLQIVDLVNPMSLVVSSFVVLLFALDGLRWRRALISFAENTDVQLTSLGESLKALSVQIAYDGNRLETKVQSLDALITDTRHRQLEAIQQVHERLEGTSEHNPQLGSGQP